MAGNERRAVFFDRDGTVIHDAGYSRDPEQVRLLPGAAEALAELRRKGFALVLVSNQSGIGRGLIRPEEAEQVHCRVALRLEEGGAPFDGAYYCPHAPEDLCRCRKPNPGMLLRAAEELGIDPGRSFMVGDKPSDVEAGRRAGCRTILLANRRGVRAEEERADVVAADWSEVLRYVLLAHEEKA
jgi:D-glycero-D-manno-heptose 1,7-bisphosphate phosphatase